jgi:hypothetical protein
MEKTNLKTTPAANECRGRIIRANDRRIEPFFCWSCGHYAERRERNCACCNFQITRKDAKLKAIKDRLDQVASGTTEPEFRFYTEQRCFWIKAKDLQEYQALAGQVRQEKYYWFIKTLLENDRLTWVLRL